MSQKNLYEFFHEKSSGPKKIIKENNFTYRNLIKILEIYLIKSKKMAILDIGCGTGTIVFYLANKGHNIYGIDISKKAIKIANNNLNFFKLKGEIKFLRKDIQKSNLQDKKFDLILCSEVIEHVENDKKLIQKIYKFLKTNGILIISVPSKNAPLYRFGKATQFDKRAGHLRRYLVKDLKKILNIGGLKILEYKKTEGVLRNFLFLNNFFGKFIRFIKGPIVELVSFIDNIFIYLFGESQIFIVAKKLKP